MWILAYLQRYSTVIHLWELLSVRDYTCDGSIRLTTFQLDTQGRNQRAHAFGFIFWDLTWSHVLRMPSLPGADGKKCRSGISKHMENECKNSYGWIGESRFPTSYCLGAHKRRATVVTNVRNDSAEQAVAMKTRLICHPRVLTHKMTKNFLKKLVTTIWNWFLFSSEHVCFHVSVVIYWMIRCLTTELFKNAEHDTCPFRWNYNSLVANLVEIWSAKFAIIDRQPQCGGRKTRRSFQGRLVMATQL